MKWLYVIWFLFVGIVVGFPSNMRARTTDGRDVVLNADRTWYFDGESPARRRVHLTQYEVPMGIEHLVDIAPWLLDEKMLSSVFRMELLPQTGDIPDLVLYRSSDGITPEQTVIRLRIDGKSGSHVGTPAQ